METITVDEAKKIIDEKLESEEVGLLDVRSEREYLEAHIPGARLVPLDEIGHHIPNLDKDKRYLVYCRSGGRSCRAGEELENYGLTVINIDGGIISWQEAGYETNTGE